MPALLSEPVGATKSACASRRNARFLTRAQRGVTRSAHASAACITADTAFPTRAADAPTGASSGARAPGLGNSAATDRAACVAVLSAAPCSPCIRQACSTGVRRGSSRLRDGIDEGEQRAIRAIGCDEEQRLVAVLRIRPGIFVSGGPEIDRRKPAAAHLCVEAVNH